MRSLLFVPADSARKLDKAMSSGADALIVDLEDSIALDGKAHAREAAAAFLKNAMTSATRPYLMVRVNGLQTGLTDADLDAIAPAKPDAIMLPKAEGGAALVHADAKLAVREAQNDLADGHIKILPIATETAAALFLVGTFAGASARLVGMTWGAEDLSAELGARTNRDEQGRFLDPYRLAAAYALLAPRPLPCRPSIRSLSISEMMLDFAANARRHVARGLSARWRFIRRRCRSSMRCSPPRRTQSRMRNR